MIEQSNLRMLASRIVDKKGYNNILIGQLINYHLQICGENTSVNMVQQSLLALINSAAATIAETEKCREQPNRGFS